MNAHKTLLKRWAPLLNYRAAGKLNVRYAIFALCHTLALASFASIAGAQAPAQITVAEALKVVNTYTIQQKSNGRYMDAHLNPATGFRVVTRPPQRNETQQWILTPVGPNTYTIQQNSHERYMDAHENAKNDFRLVTRPAQRNDTQQWILTPVGPNTYTIQQKSNGRYMDAHENAKNDFRLSLDHRSGTTHRNGS
jgi:hypothetical protein